MKLCEALKEGLKLNLPKTTGSYFDLNERGQLCACAMGKALLGAGVVTLEQAEKYAVEGGLPDSPWRYTTVKVPEALAERLEGSMPDWSVASYEPGDSERIGTLVATMNDSGVFTDEEIVQAVCQLENQDV